MGGKTWSREEELYFWRVIVPLSPKAAAAAGKPLDWEQLAANMQTHFGRKARRRYTNLMLYEHYFQNVTTGHKSPKASDLVLEHRKHLEIHGRDPDEVASGERKPRTRQYAKRKKSASSTDVTNKPTRDASGLRPLKKHKTDDAAGKTAALTSNSDMRPQLQQKQPEDSARATNMSMNSDGSNHVRREVYIPPATQMPTPIAAYQNGFYYGGLMATPQSDLYGTTSNHPHPAPFFNDVVWNTGTDSGYASVATSSLGGSPTSPATHESDNTTDATAYTENLAK
ncbi:hypothetical protein TOPH_01550 [Tolypocladium ophioglossoides CBS 100239]|uniref:Uncharacterized protein n=1 Tax=Tolypocladium ophioglossoides (strain CBS 100239) TaxID=1163406 RepID=A0A0L0NIQ8_TOLOC|nr:hypothetical protein TOPH_01550 [Tolypocladium ophioglossoides CBS 100239]